MTERSSFDKVVAAAESAGLRFEHVKPDDVMVQCPAHADGRPSLHVSWRDGQTLLKCFAECDTAAIVAALGLRIADLFDEQLAITVSTTPQEGTMLRGTRFGEPSGDILKGLGWRWSPQQRGWTLGGRKDAAGVVAETVRALTGAGFRVDADVASTAASGRKPAKRRVAAKAKGKAAPAAAPRKASDEDLFGPATGPERQVAEYPYTDCDGVVVGRQVRLEVPRERGHSKRFVQEHPAEGCSEDHKSRRGKAGVGWHLGGWPDQGLYLLTEVLSSIAEDPDRPVVVGEGEKDVETARDRLGLVATTNCGGAGNWNTTCAGQLAGAREVWVVLDRDEAGYRRGLAVPGTLDPATRVRLLLPVERDGIKDLTDHVAAGFGAGDLVEVHATDLIRLWAAVAADKAAAWLANAVLNGDPDLQLLLGDALAETLQVVVEHADPQAAGAAVVGDYLADLLGQGGQDVEAAAGEEPAVRRWLKRPVYAVIDGAICKRTKKGTPATEDSEGTPEEWQVLLGCVARVERAEYVDNGDEDVVDPDEVPLTSTMVVRWSRHVDGKVIDLGVQRVPADKWHKGEWISTSPAVAAGAEIPATPMDRGRAAEAIRMTSTGLTERTPVYSAIGWRKAADGSAYYVHAGQGSGQGQAITADSVRPVRTQLAGPAAHYTLPEPPASRVQWRAAFDELMVMMDALPPRIGSVLIGVAGRATLGWTGTSLVLTGEKGAGKTSMATLLGAFYDPDLPYDRPRLSLAKMGATALAMRRLMNQTADSIALLDDANPDAGTAAAAKVMADHARAHFGEMDRPRADRDGQGVKSGGKPRNTQVMTGELSPADAGLNSAESRIFPIHVDAGEVDVKTVLPDLHRKARRRLRSSALAGLIQWIAPRLDELRAEKDSLIGREESSTYAQLFDAAGMPERTAVALADYLVGWRLWLRAAESMGAISTERGEALWRRAFDGLLEAGHSALQFADTTHYDGQMREYLQSALSMGEAHMIGWGQQDLPVSLALACGWKEDPRPQFIGQEADGSYPVVAQLVTPMGKRVGWLDVEQERAYLDPEAVIRVCSQMAKFAGTTWDTTRRVVGAALRASGRSRPEIERVGDRIVHRSERRLRDGNRKVPVWDTAIDWILGLGDDPDDSTGQRSKPTPPPLFGPGDGIGSEDVRQDLDEAVPAALAAGAEHDPIPPVTGGKVMAPVASAGVQDSAAGPGRGSVEEVSVLAARQQQLHVGVHPFDVLEPTFDHLLPEELERCIGCGHPCSMRFGEIVLHPACEPPAGLVYDDAGTIIRDRDTTEPLFDGERGTQVAMDPDEVAAEAVPAVVSGETVVDPEPVDAAVSTPVPVGAEESQGVGGAETDRRWRALVAVADTEGLHLADGTRFDLPEALTHAGQLAQAGIDLGLGWGEYDRNWQPERGQVWLMPDLVDRLKLPKSLPSQRDTRAWRKLAGHPWLAGADAEGWRFGQKDGQPLPQLKPWTTLWQDGGGGLTIAVPHWTTGGGGQLHQVDRDDAPTAQQLAARIESYAATLGLPYTWGPGVSGLRLLQYLHRDPRHTRITRTIELPPPATARKSGEVELMWHRAPTDAEAATQWVYQYDGNAMYLAAANSLAVGLDEPAEHFDGSAPIGFDAGRPGFWRLAEPVEYPGDGLMPTLADAVRIEEDGSCWVTTPTLGLLVKDWKLAPQIVEAYLWPKAKGNRVFDTFYTVGRDALYQLPRDADEETKRRRQVIKSVYTAAFGRLARLLPPGQAGDKWWRPDWDQIVIANAAAKLLRVVARVGAETGRWPVAILTDAVYYASDEATAAAAAPAGLPLDQVQLGKFKYKDGAEGRARMADALEYLRAPVSDGFAELFKASDEDGGE